MNKKKLLSDYVFNLFRLMLNIGIPLVTLPFVIRRIGAENYGIFTYTSSIAAYFTMFAMLGVPNYALRVVARQKDGDKEEFKRNVTEIYILQILSVTLTLILYLICYLFFFSEEYRNIYFILSLSLFSNFFNVEWFYTGSHKFKYMSLRGIFFKILNVCAILLIIKHGDSAAVYAYITVFTSVLNRFVDFMGFFRYLNFSNIQINRHFKPILILFSLSIADLINSNIDKTLTGYIAGPLFVGYYGIGFRLTRVVQQLFASLNTVIYPRIITYLSESKKNLSHKLIFFNMNFIVFLSAPIILGIYLYSQQLILFLFGEELLPAVWVLRILGCTIFIIAVRRLIRKQIFLPYNMDKIMLVITITNITLNVILTSILVRTYRHTGAAVATFMTEFLIFLFEIVIVYRKVGIRLFKLNQFKYLLSSLILLLPYYFLPNMYNNNIGGLFIVVILSAVGYFSLIIFMRDDFLYFLVNRVLRKKQGNHRPPK